MATITLQDTAVTLELAHREDIEMYHATFCSEMGGWPSRDDGEGFAPRGSSPLGQSYPQGGPYAELPGGPPRGPPGGGGGGGPPMGGRGNQNTGLPLQVGPQQGFVNGSLKGIALTIFDRNRKNTKQFTQEFTIYRMIN